MQLRLTRYDLMTNGDDEGNEAVRVARGILEDLNKEGRISHSLFEMIIEAMRSDMNSSFTHYYPELGKRVPCIPYVICFTHIDANDDGNAEWISKRDLRMESRIDFELLELFAVSPKGHLGLSNWYGFHEFRWIDYGKESIRNTMEWCIREQLKICRNRGMPDGLVCTYICGIVNEERMFLHSSGFEYQKEARFVVYVPLDHDAIPGFDEVVKTRRIRDDSNNLVYLPSDSDDYIYLNLRIPLESLTVTVMNADVVDRVVAVMKGAANSKLINQYVLKCRSDSDIKLINPTT